MYSLDQLLADCLRLRGPLLKSRSDDGSFGGYRMVWDAFNRYLTATVEKKATLNIVNFCKIGWKIEEQARSVQQPRLRPHFQLAEGFLRAYGAEYHAREPILTDKHMTSIEDFNFSKAAIRYSHSLTKENIFIGLRSIIQQLGEAIARGESVSLDFEVGKLLCHERDISFNFARELYMREAIPIPEGAVQAGEYKPSVSFAPPSKDAMTLSLRGANPTAKADHHGGWDDKSHAIEAEEQTLESMSMARAGSTAVSARDSVHQAALSRHLQQMERDAVTAVTDKQQWEAHLQRCQMEERKDADWRRALKKEHSEQLKAQMQHAEERRQEGRDIHIQQASCHDFPSFKEVDENNFAGYIRDKRYGLKEDLDQQVQAKQRIKRVEKERDQMLESYHIEATKRELEAIRKEAQQKREGERAQLKKAWADDNYLKSVKRAIQDHHKVSGDKALVMGMSGIGGDARHGTPRTVGLGPPGLGPMASPRSMDGGSSAPPSSRPPTGSVRRMPIGAAASLALHKERMNATTRR